MMYVLLVTFSVQFISKHLILKLQILSLQQWSRLKLLVDFKYYSKQLNRPYFFIAAQAKDGFGATNVPVILISFRI